MLLFWDCCSISSHSFHNPVNLRFSNQASHVWTVKILVVQRQLYRCVTTVSLRNLHLHCTHSSRIWCRAGILTSKLCQALTYYWVLSSQPHLAGFRWITYCKIDSRIFQWNFLWRRKSISRFIRRGSWNLNILSFRFQFVCPS